MTSLTDVYEGGINTVADPRQRRLGMGLFVIGAAMVVGSIPIATTDLSTILGLDSLAAREVAGILAGLGIPAVFVGIFVVLPAGNASRGAATIGATLATFGVILFQFAYPEQWLSSNPQLAIATTAIYSLGTLITVWCLFISVATFDRRQDPGGTARIEITEEGKVKVVSKSPDLSGTGSVGLFGNDPDGSVPTQTNEAAVTRGSDTTATQSQNPQPTSDGGSAVADDPFVDDEITEAARQRGIPDKYCGNCAHFKYVRVDGKIRPYCGFDQELMDDMDACEQWEAN
ncbi:DUF7139 domain-containing protein [Halobacteriaceae archaeon SHR40]|uniref:DUF7139 domain-containing protein n=1 Tax=Halovenus amylolytica TaxID=2500550 RepID=UPI000FE30600